MLDAINIHKGTKKSIQDWQKRIERRIDKIEKNIIEAMRNSEFKLNYGIEERFNEQIVEYFRDSGFDVEYTNQNLSVSWEFNNYPTNYFIHMENLKEYKNRLKSVDGIEFSDVFKSIDPIQNRDILIEIRQLLKRKKTRFYIEELDDTDYENVKKMLEMMGLVVNPKEVEFSYDCTFYRNIEVYIGAN